MWQIKESKSVTMSHDEMTTFWFLAMLWVFLPYYYVSCENKKLVKGKQTASVTPDDADADY